MNCQNCGEPLEHGTLFCESCGARIAKGSTLVPAHTSSRRKKKKRLTRSGILFVMLGSAAVIAMVFAVVSIIRTASMKSDPQQINSGDVETSSSAPVGFASAEEQTAYWQSVYRPYLEQLIPERMNANNIAPVLWFALVDMNGDGTPELVDCFAEDGVSAPYSLRVYYIDCGAIRLLGTADVGIHITPMFQAYKDKALGTLCFVSGVEVSISDEYQLDGSLWGCQSNGELYFERLFFQQTSPNRNRLLEIADSDSIYYDSETGLYTISVYQGAYVPPDVLEDKMNAFINQYESPPQPINWFLDGSEDGSYPSHYTEYISTGMSAVSAADKLIGSIFQTYNAAANDTGEDIPIFP